jgi:1,4-dihydroxy-2-naphthoyl-CoA hydrolase
MSIWKQSFDLEGLNAMTSNGLSGHLGIKFIRFDDRCLIAEMPVTEDHKQPLGLLHGGATAALAETLGSIASVLATEGQIPSAVGVELNINHLRSVREGKVIGICSPIKLGKTIHVWNIEIFGESERQISASRLTTMVKNMTE